MRKLIIIVALLALAGCETVNQYDNMAGCDYRDDQCYHTGGPGSNASHNS